jgi:hypothetical protein
MLIDLWLETKGVISLVSFIDPRAVSSSLSHLHHDESSRLVIAGSYTVQPTASVDSIPFLSQSGNMLTL